MSRPTIKYGSTGETVKELQTALNRAGSNLTVEGIFGSKTASAVKTFQKKNGLTADGIVGAVTWEKLQIYLNGCDNAIEAIKDCLSAIEKLPEFQKVVQLINGES